MSTVAKILIVVNLVLAAAFLMAASNFLGQEDDWKFKYDDAVKDYTVKLQEKDTTITQKQTEITALLGQNRDVTNQLTEAKKENQEVRSMNDLLKEAHSQTSTQLTTATAALDAAQKTIKSNREMIDALQQERTGLAEAKRLAQEQKESVTRAMNEKEVQFENLLAEKQTLEARITDLEKELNEARLTTQVAVAKGGSGDVPMPQPAHRGQVLDVDDRANIAIISLGEEDGVKPGFRYTVYRGGNFVATIEIVDVQAKQSAGRAVDGLKKSSIRRGDGVTSR